MMAGSMKDFRFNPPDDDGTDDLEVEELDVKFDDFDSSDPITPDINAEWERNYADQTEWNYQFSLAELMMVIAFAAVILTAVRLFAGSLSITAFVLGVSTALGLILLRTSTGFGGLFHLCWWMLLALYLIVSLVAMVMG